MDLSDQTYDGRDEGDRLVGGLGQLVDGQRGTDNFRTDIHGFGKGEYTVFRISSFFLFNSWHAFRLRMGWLAQRLCSTGGDGV